MSNFVIAISAASGGGKTALVKRTAELLGGTTLFFDDYAPRFDPYPDLIHWIENGARLDQWQAPHFTQAIAALKRGERIVHPVTQQTIIPGKFIVLEDPIGRGCAEMSAVIDFMVFILSL